MPASIAGTVGRPTTRTTGTQTMRMGDKNEQIVALGRAAKAEQTQNGEMFAAFIPPGTGQAPGTAIGTTACFTLASSNATVRLVVHKIMVGYISGTLGAGTLALLAHQAAAGVVAPSGGTAITPTNMLLGSATVSVANCRFNNTVPASGLMVRAITNLTALLASTAVGLYSVIDAVDGEIIINSGQAISVQGIAAAGTSPLITVGMVWAEEPL